MTQITGTIKRIFNTQQVSEKFAKRDLVVTTNEMYPQDVKMQFTQDKCGLLDLYKEMDQVVVDINIRGREWINKEGEEVYFVTLEAWKINHDNGGQNSPQQQPTHSGIPAQVLDEHGNDINNEDDDLPF